MQIQQLITIITRTQRIHTHNSLIIRPMGQSSQAPNANEQLKIIMDGE